jgi:NADH-quinone oxidoreductase subunit M
MSSWPILLDHHVPAAPRRAVDLLPAGRRRGGEPQCALGRAVDHAGHLRCVAHTWSGASIPASPEFQFVEKQPWLGGLGAYHMGVDGISLPFVILTTGLMPLCILASWEVIQTRVKEYMIAFLALETLMVGTFSALDLVVFYLFFEGGLIPMFLIIGVWGGPAPRLCELQVLPLHAARLGADAARHHGDVLAGGHDRHPDADEVRLPAGHADLAVARVLRLVRREDADVAGAHVAPRRASSRRRPRAR